MSLDAELTLDEGSRAKPYRDSVGKLTIGVGRNLDDVGLSADEIAYLLKNDIARARALLDRRAPWWRTLDPVRQDALVNMAFNMGNRLFQFENMLGALQTGSWATASKEALASKWATQVGDRAKRIAKMFRTGAR